MKLTKLKIITCKPELNILKTVGRVGRTDEQNADDFELFFKFTKNRDHRLKMKE